MKKRCPDLAILLLAVGLLAGCASSPYRSYPQYGGPSREVPPQPLFISDTYRTHPQYERRLRDLRSVALMPPDAKVYSLTAGEKRDLVDEWSETARKNLAQAIATHVGAAGQFVLEEFDPIRFPSARQEYEDVRPLFEAVSLRALAHAHFEYSLGPLTSLAQATKADALLFVYATDYISTGGRKALWGLLVPLVVPLGLFVQSGELAVALAFAGGRTQVATALVEAKTGDIILFSTHVSMGFQDLRDYASAQSLISEAFDDLKKIVSRESVTKEN